MQPTSSKGRQQQRVVHYKPIGIDLGTTNSAIAYFNTKTGRAEVVREKLNQNETIASMVAVGRDNNFEIGLIASENFPKNIRNTAYEVKRFIGLTEQQLGATGFKRFAMDVTYRLESDGKENPPKIVLGMGDEMLRLEAWEISRILLKHLRELAEEQLKEGEERVCCESAVITVPAYFLDEQRAATKRAAMEVGFKNVLLLSEPVAAAYNYGMSVRRKPNDHYTIFVFDQGGGTTDLSIINAKNGHFEERHFSGDPNFGGRDFDRFLVRYFNQKIQQMAKEEGLDKDGGKSYDVDLEGNESIRYSLRKKCIKLKEKLSGTDSAKLYLSQIFAQKFPLEMSLRDFESAEVCGSLFDRCLQLIRECLDDAGMEPEDFNVVLFMGGSTRMTAYKRMFTEELGFSKEQIVARELDTGVALGASIHAAQKFLKGEEKEKAQLQGGSFARSIAKMLALPIGIRAVNPNNVREDVCSIVFPADTEYPASVERHFATDGGQNVQIEIMENHRRPRANAVVGAVEEEMPLARNCRRLCFFQAAVGNLRVRGEEAALLIRFELNDDRVLSVHALNAVTNQLLAEHQTRFKSLRDTTGVDDLFGKMNL